MDYFFLPEVARDLCIPVKVLKELCEQSQIKGAIRHGRVWMLPSDVDEQLKDRQDGYLAYCRKTIVV